jgi:hypothetical protein
MLSALRLDQDPVALEQGPSDGIAAAVLAIDPSLDRGAQLEGLRIRKLKSLKGSRG